MTGWLRANRVGLTAAVVLLPLLWALLVPLPVSQSNGRTDVIEQVPADDDGILFGVRYRVLLADEFTPPEDISTPRGTALVAAIVEAAPVDPDAFTAACRFTLSAPGGSDRVVWSATSDSETAGYGYGRGEGLADLCEAEPTARYRAELVFLAQAGTGARGAIDVTAQEASGVPAQVLRLRLPPPTPPGSAAG